METMIAPQDENTMALVANAEEIIRIAVDCDTEMLHGDQKFAKRAEALNSTFAVAARLTDRQMASIAAKHMDAEVEAMLILIGDARTARLRASHKMFQTAIKNAR